MVVGESTGAILGSFMTQKQFSMVDATEAFKDYGENFFPQSVSRLSGAWNYLGYDCYSAVPLESWLKKYFPKDKLADKENPRKLVCPTVLSFSRPLVSLFRIPELHHKQLAIAVLDVTTLSDPKVDYFQNYGPANPYGKTNLWEVLRATSAAPSFFPSIQIDSMPTRTLC